MSVRFDCITIVEGLLLATGARIDTRITSSLKTDVIIEADVRLFAAVIILFFTHRFVSSDFPFRDIPQVCEVGHVFLWRIKFGRWHGSSSI